MSSAALQTSSPPNSKSEIKVVYADGGVIQINPSPLGGTWAACHVDAEGQCVWNDSGVILPKNWEMSAITNNFSELYALTRALQELPDGWSGEVFSDSNITRGRLFWSFKWTGIPTVLRRTAMDNVARLGELRPVLLDGHPTKSQLESGFGKRGNPVSKWNVWCDKACGEQARKFLIENREVAPNVGDSQ